jgi:hypothetical protein
MGGSLCPELKACHELKSRESRTGNWEIDKKTPISISCTNFTTALRAKQVQNCSDSVFRGLLWQDIRMLCCRQWVSTAENWGIKHKHIMYEPYNCSTPKQVQKTSIGPEEGLRRTMDFSSAPQRGSLYPEEHINRAARENRERPS